MRTLPTRTQMIAQVLISTRKHDEWRAAPRKQKRMEEPALAACPFCGVKSWQILENDVTAQQVECCHCGARGPLTIPGRIPAIESWNERLKPRAFNGAREPQGESNGS